MADEVARFVVVRNPAGPVESTSTKFPAVAIGGASGGRRAIRIKQTSLVGTIKADPITAASKDLTRLAPRDQALLDLISQDLTKRPSSPEGLAARLAEKLQVREQDIKRRAEKAIEAEIDRVLSSQQTGDDQGAIAAVSNFQALGWLLDPKAHQESAYQLIIPEQFEGYFRELVRFKPQLPPNRRIRLSYPKLLGRPGFADLYVVQSEWVRYQAGEIADIQNVIAGESRIYTTEELHKTVRTEEDETTRRESTMVRSEESESESLESETQRQTALAVHAEGQLTTSGQFGTVKIDLNVGGGIELNMAESVRRATATARESVQLAVEQKAKDVRELRRTKTTDSSAKITRHEIDNKAEGARDRNLVYRWVDRVVRYQTKRLPHRFVVEFYVPDPGAIARALDKRRREGSDTLGKPPALTKALVGGGNQPLGPSDINSGNVSQLIATFRAEGVPPPPDPTLAVSSAVVLRADNSATVDDSGNEKAIKIETMTAANRDTTLAVPDGYVATSANVSVGFLPNYGLYPDGYLTVNGQKTVTSAAIGYHAGVVTVSIGNKTFIIRQDDTGAFYGNVFNVTDKDFVDIAEEGFDWSQVSGYVGPVPVSIGLSGTAMATVGIDLLCQLLPSTMSEWQIVAYEAIARAHADRTREYDNRRMDAGLGSDAALATAAPHDSAARIRTELQRSVIELLLGYRFNGVGGSVVQHPGPPGFNADALRIDHSTVERAGSVVTFLQHAIEWEYMTYVMYPYFWSDASNWAELMVQDSPNPEWLKFLQAGGARVVLSARPGFERALNWFISTGQVWLGGDPPTFDSPLYLSIADEIRQLTSPREEGEVCDVWESVAPTSMIWLEGEPALPIANVNSTIMQPAEAH